MATYLAFGCSSPSEIQNNGKGDSGGDIDSGGDDPGAAPPTPAQIPTALDGVVQKGPFNQGSSITISELNETFSPVGSSYDVTTEDDLGSFSIDSLSGDYQYVEIIGAGFYYNEVSGEDSDVQITLRTVSDTTVSDDLRVNVLTTLARNRIMYLVTEEDMDYEDARLQAQNEVLDIFNIDVDDVSNFDVMDISEDGDSNAILLAISLMLQGELDVSDLQSLVNGMANDLEEDGDVDNDDYLDQICANAGMLDLSGIRISLEAKFTALGITNPEIPAFEGYVDTDCDGAINMSDDETPVWTYAGAMEGIENLMSGTMTFYFAVELNDKMKPLKN